jgi:hypothetical protein
LINLQTLSISLGEDSPDLSPLMASVGVSLEAPLDLLFLASMDRLKYLRLDTLKRLTLEGAVMLGSKKSLVALALPQCTLVQTMYPPLRLLTDLKYLSCLRCHFSAPQLTESFPHLQQVEIPDGFVVEDPLEDFPSTSRPSDEFTLPLTPGSHTNIIGITHSAASVPGITSLDVTMTTTSPSSPSSQFHPLGDLKSTPREEILDVGSPQSPMYHIPSLTRLEVDFESTSDLVSAIFACSASLRQLHLFDDQEEAPSFDEGLEQSYCDLLHTKMRLPALPQLRSIFSYSAAQRLDWASCMLDTFSASPHLTHVSLSTGSAGGGHFPPSFDRALGGLESLESLELRNFRHIDSLSCLANLHRMKSLNIVGLESQASESGGGKSTTFQDIANSRSIERLGITYSHEVSDADLRVIVKKMRQLKELDLTSLERISDRTLKRLSKPNKGLCSLSVIRVKYCPLLTPDGLLALSNLRHLYHIETSVQSRFLYAEDQSQIDLLFAKFCSIFVSTS